MNGTSLRGVSVMPIEANLSRRMECEMVSKAALRSRRMNVCRVIKKITKQVNNQVCVHMSCVVLIKKDYAFQVSELQAPAY